GVVDLRAPGQAHLQRLRKLRKLAAVALTPIDANTAVESLPADHRTTRGTCVAALLLAARREVGGRHTAGAHAALRPNAPVPFALALLARLGALLVAIPHAGHESRAIRLGVA